MSTYKDTIKALANKGCNVIVSVRRGTKRYRWESQYTDIQRALDYLEFPSVTKKNVKFGIITVNNQTTFTFIFNEDEEQAKARVLCNNCDGEALGLCESCAKMRKETDYGD